MVGRWGGKGVVDPASNQDIEHLGHLRKDEHAVAFGLELAQHTIKHLQLAAVRLLERESERLGCCVRLFYNFTHPETTQTWMSWRSGKPSRVLEACSCTMFLVRAAELLAGWCWWVSTSQVCAYTSASSSCSACSRTCSGVREPLM